MKTSKCKEIRKEIGPALHREEPRGLQQRPIGVMASATTGELTCLKELGARYIQGFLFSRPAFEALPDIELSSRGIARAA